MLTESQTNPRQELQNLSSEKERDRNAKDINPSKVKTEKKENKQLNKKEIVGESESENTKKIEKSPDTRKEDPKSKMKLGETSPKSLSSNHNEISQEMSSLYSRNPSDQFQKGLGLEMNMQKNISNQYSSQGSLPNQGYQSMQPFMNQSTSDSSMNTFGGGLWGPSPSHQSQNSQQQFGDFRDMGMSMYRDGPPIPFPPSNGIFGMDSMGGMSGLGGLGCMGNMNNLNGIGDLNSMNRLDDSSIPISNPRFFQQETPRKRMRANSEPAPVDSLMSSFNIWSLSKQNSYGNIGSDTIGSDVDMSQPPFLQGSFFNEGTTYGYPSQLGSQQQGMQNIQSQYSQPMASTGVPSNQNSILNRSFSNSVTNQNISNVPSQQKSSLRYNIAAPEFRPTSTISSEKPPMGSNKQIPSLHPSPPKSKRHNAPMDASNSRFNRNSGNSIPRRHSVTLPSSCSHIAPLSGLSETNQTKVPITINPMRTTGNNNRGTSSRQNQVAQSTSRQDSLVKAIYHKLITCQSGDCRRRHSCIECLECNSLFCENCSNINLYALVLMDQSGPEETKPDDEDGWELMGSSVDLHQIPGYCPSCDGQERFSINLAMMKLLMQSEEYKRFSGMIRRSRKQQRNR